MLITLDSPGVSKALASRLAARGVEVVFNDGGAPAPGALAGSFTSTELTAREADFRAFTRRALAPAHQVGPTAELFLTVAALGGRLSAAGGGKKALGQVGALGFTRALAQEWPDAVVKAIDVELGLGTEAIAQAIFDELVSGDRRVEAGYSSGGRVGLEQTRALGPVAARSTRVRWCW